jgi:membrane-associated phospholipid phosphatase
MRSLLTLNKWFYLLYLGILIFVGFFLFNYSKSEFHLWLNQYHSTFFDYFFKYLTHLGNGTFLPLFLLLMVLRKYRDGLFLVVVFLLSGLIVQVLKLFVFHHVLRPVTYFGEGVQLHLVKGVEQLCCNSFPSGHSATAFGFYICFAIVSKNNLVKVLMLILACLVAFSRVYLSQHFLADIFAGSLIGVITATLCYFWIYSLKSEWLDKNLKIIKHKI